LLNNVGGDKTNGKQQTAQHKGNGNLFFHTSCFLRGVQAHVPHGKILQKLFANLALISEKAKEAKPIPGFASFEKRKLYLYLSDYQIIR
jgi:hypothetical protein